MTRLVTPVMWLSLLGTLGSVAAGPACARSTPAESASAGAPLDLESYVSKLNRLRQGIAKSDHDPSELCRLRESLPPRCLVEIEQERYEIPTDWLATALDTIEKEPGQHKFLRHQFEQHLEAMREAASELDRGAANPPVARARVELDRILESREFRGMRGPSWLDLMRQRISGWIANQISKILSRLHFGGKGGDVLTWSLIALSFLALLLWVRSSLARISRGASLVLSPAAAASDLHNWAREALAAAGRGDYREAVHCAYWAGIARMEDLGMLPRDRARTPRESLRLLPADHAYRGAMNTLTECLERVWYGFRPATASDWSDVITQLERMGCPLPSMPATAGS
jgi:Domain of unknown function (DUF4129)